MTIAIPFGLPPLEAIQYFERKGYAISFAWQDVWREQHARAFTVAKMMRVDLLESVRKAMDKAIADGTTLEPFRKQLTPILQREGWWGAQRAVDPKDGREKIVQLGSPRRLETIYDTNLRFAQSAGRWQQVERTKRLRPYLRYIHLDNARPRQQHLAWNNLVLAADHAFWRTHFPPNGWRCHCYTQQLSAADLDRLGLSVSPDPVVRTIPYKNPRTGEVRRVPVGIDPGFDMNAGVVSLDDYRKMLADRIDTAAPDLREALSA